MIGLSDICRYPKETLTNRTSTASTICSSSPSEESPVEIIIDVSDRPITTYTGFWIQFDHRYVAEDYTISFDRENNGTFPNPSIVIKGNTQPLSYRLDFQSGTDKKYRIKISITKALQIPNFEYSDANYVVHTLDYNPDGLVGIVNFGMPSNEAYGRAFLGECGGSLYGDVNMHSNTLKNLPTPVEDGDAVNKSYVTECISNLPTYEGTYREIYGGEMVDEVELITFYYESTPYQCVEGMTWLEFSNSEYNTNQDFSAYSNGNVYHIKYGAPVYTVSGG